MAHTTLLLKAGKFTVEALVNLVEEVGELEPEVFGHAEANKVGCKHSSLGLVRVAKVLEVSVSGVRTCWIVTSETKAH
jgi:hypothetical protein